MKRRDVTDELMVGMRETHAIAKGEMQPAAIHFFPNVRAIRKETGPSRAEFARKFALDPRALQDWEQGRRVPDRAARAYLMVIAKRPDAVVEALVG